jgi:purine-binding chemotaxis protein CheW
VKEVTEIEARAIQAPPSAGAKYKIEFIEGMVKMDEQFIMVLDVDKVFSSDEISFLQDATTTPA